MELRQMEYFYAVSKYGSFTRAAEILYVSQPSITNAIHKLEKELKIILLDRSQKKIIPTAEGKVFLARVEKILREVQESAVEMNDLRNLNKGTIKLAVPPMIGAYLFPDIFNFFKKQYPNLDLTVFEEGSLAARNKLEKEDLDLGLIILPQASKVLNTLEITKEQIILCVSPEHRLSGEKTASFSMLPDESFILLKDDYYHRQTVIDECRKNGFDPKVVFSSGQIQTVKGLVASGAGISFLMEMVVKDDETICGIPLADPLEICIGLAWKKDKYLSKASRAFIDFVTAYLK